MTTFKEKYTFKKRLVASTVIMEHNPGRFPIIVEMGEKQGTEKLPALIKKKYLTPDMSYPQFLYVIRKRIALEPEKAMFMFVGENGEIPPIGASITNLYEKYKDEDGFLYFSAVGEYRTNPITDFSSTDRDMDSIERSSFKGGKIFVGDSCSICLEKYDFTNDELVSLKCGHVWHKHCIDEYVKKECPLCKIKL
jgi:GABA(A) receptor-associated protein